MKIAIALLFVLSFASIAYATGENGKYEIESGIFGKESPIKLLMQGLIKDGDSTELNTYIKIFNQVFPLLKAFADPTKSGNGQAIKEFHYEWCLTGSKGQNIFCVDMSWNFVVGWRANQFHDDKRFYNLTVIPYAYMNSVFNFTTESDPIKLYIGPNFKFVDFHAPLSFEMENKDTLCYSGFVTVNPIVIDAGIGAKFLECQVMIPEDVQSCDWTAPIDARIFNFQLNDGYTTTLLDRTCVHSG